ncbi:hypothetical protein ACV7JQ_07115 [Globicatella sulfidifaciens]
MVEILEKYTVNGISGQLMGFKKNNTIAVIYDGKQNHEVDLTKIKNGETHKRCCDCDKILPLESFSRLKGKILRKQCKQCMGRRIRHGRKKSQLRKRKVAETGQTIQEYVEKRWGIKC